MATPKTTPNATAEAAPAAPVTPSRAYMQVLNVDTDSGEITEKSRFKYLPGHPRQIRFDGKAGVFNEGGNEVIGKSLTFIPVALRVFVDSLFGSVRKPWAELFFFDDRGIMCGLLVHGYSVENLLKCNASLFYDDLRLVDTVLTIKPAKKENKKVGGSYFIAEFTHAAADPAEVQARQEYAEDFNIYREETATDTAEMRINQGYQLPAGFVPIKRLEAALANEATTETK
jgi:hypothetical protein